MATFKSKCISMLLAVVMVITMVFGVIPPVKVYALSAEEGGEGNLTISSPSHGDEINGYEDIKIKWNKVSGADHYWITVKDNVTGSKPINEECSSTSYTISYDDDIFEVDERVYKIYVAAMDEDGNVLSNGADWNAIYVTNVFELEYDITVETIDTDGDQTINTLEMLAELYVDSNVEMGSVQVGFEYGLAGGTQRKTKDTMGYYDGDEFGWTLTGLEPGTDYTYRGFAIDPITGDYIYGDRITITTLDEADMLPEVSTDSATDITLTSAVINGYLDYTADLTTEYGFILGTGVTEQVKIGSTTKTKSFEYEWDYLQPDTKYTYKTYAENEYGVVYGENKTFYTESDDEAPVIELLESSLGTEFLYGSSVTITAEASDNVALSEFILYIDDVEVEYSDYYTDYEELEYSTSTLAAGTHIIKAYAVDDGGNEASKTLTITVTEPVGTGILGDVNSDGLVTNLDRFILNRYLNSMSGYTTNMVNKESADIDGDGEITDDDCTILARHLFGWIGYEDLSAFYVGPTETPVTDTSVWDMSFSSNAVTIEVELTEGTPDSSKNYLFIAEDEAGLHYTGIIDAGKTSASFSVKGLQMPRGEMYSYYVLPEGVVLAGNKDKYCIGKCAVPLFNGNMITSVTSNEKTVSNGGNIYAGNTVTINWDGSYGVDNFSIIAKIDGTIIDSQTYSHSGPGTFVINGDSIEVGTLKVTATVTAPSESGLANAVSSWSANIIEQPVDEKEFRTELMVDMTDRYFDPSRSFELYDDLVKDEISIGLFDLVFADITDLGGVVEKVVGGDADVTNAKHTIALLIDNMDDDVYVPAATECADVIVTLYEVIQDTPYDDLRDLFSGVVNEAEVISTIASIKQINIDTVNNSLSQYIEYLFELGIDDATVMEKYAEVLTWQNNNLSKKNALRKVQKATGTFSKSTKGIMDALGTISTVGDILSILYDAGIKDYSAQLIKLSVLEEALKNYNYDHLSNAADELRTEMENRLVKLAADSAKYGLEYAAQAASGLWGIVSASVSITVGQDAMAKRDACYLLEIEDALYYHVLSMKSEYIDSGAENTLLSIVQEIHAIADCRAMLNTLGMELNQWGIFVTDKDKYDYFMIYNNWYNNQHDDIDEFFTY